MIGSKRLTLPQYLIEQRRYFPDASGEFNALILEVALACKAIARAVACGELADEHAAPGAAPTKLESLGNDMFVRATEWAGHLAGLASTTLAQPYQIPAPYGRGHYLLVFDPLDGAPHVDVNVPVGSLFSILRAATPGRPVGERDFLQNGQCQVAAGYAIYGPATMFVLTVGNGVVGFTLEPALGEFLLTHRDVRMPDDTRDFAVNTSQRRYWEPPVRRYVEECLAGGTGPRGSDFNMRWIASLVAETHRVLMRGGVFLYPRDTRDAQLSGQLRLLHQANPIAMLVEQAGGRASTGRQAVLSVEPTALHQRIGFVCGSRHEVERIEKYHREPTGRVAANPLFAERSLFRD